ncbi:hypothetical protein BCR36DRAFT_413400 [Piromyces finnis]|uniref:Cullin N-terminal domain-containing protein n=1 Tax=Piromyces finnis TaxID=1754191 RepID=A0A1Y1V7J9_9FUNG|nr:hypothetical protein BCR36DRAFT_413400 [Piromyces finnis]|eukprot:ORX47873.1 hypothetical protein BCR36DRAFT_413400 [Piromyces finnis]
MPKSIVSFKNEFPLNKCDIDNDMTYYNKNFPILKNFVDVVLHYNKQLTTPLRLFSHEELYRIVYTLCRQGHKKLLYDNIIEIYCNFCSETIKELNFIEQNETWLTILSQIVANYVKTYDIIINIFAYLNKTYIMEELKTSLTVILKKIFEDYLFVYIKDRLSYSLCMYTNNNIQIPQTLIITITQALYTLNPSFAYINPMLFRKSVSNFIVPKNFTELQVNYTKQEAQYFINLIKNESLNEISSPYSSLSYSSIYSIDIDSEDISEKNDITSLNLYSPINKEVTLNVSHLPPKRSFNNSNIYDNNFDNYSNKRPRIILES